MTPTKKPKRERVIWVVEQQFPGKRWGSFNVADTQGDAVILLEQAEQEAAEQWPVREQPSYRLVPYVRRGAK